MLSTFVKCHKKVSNERVSSDIYIYTSVREDSVSRVKEEAANGKLSRVKNPHPCSADEEVESLMIFVITKRHVETSRENRRANYSEEKRKRERERERVRKGFHLAHSNPYLAPTRGFLA